MGGDSQIKSGFANSIKDKGIAMDGVGYNWICGACDVTVGAEYIDCDQCGCPSGASGKSTRFYKNHKNNGGYKSNYLGSFLNSSKITETEAEITISFTPILTVFAALFFFALSYVSVMVGFGSSLRSYSGMLMFGLIALVVFLLGLGMVSMHIKIVWMKGAEKFTLRRGIGWFSRTTRHRRSSYRVRTRLVGSPGGWVVCLVPANKSETYCNRIEVRGIGIGRDELEEASAFALDLQDALKMEFD